MAFVHVIFNKVESKQASRAFVTPTTLNVPHDFTSSLFRSPVLCPLLLDCRLASRFLVPSHRLGHNLFRLRLSFRVSSFRLVFIPSISHYPTNSSLIRSSRKSSCPRSSTRPIAIDTRLRHLFLSHSFRICNLSAPANRHICNLEFFFLYAVHLACFRSI